MVRSKRIRKFKLKLLAAAGIFVLVAAFLTFILLDIFVFKKQGDDGASVTTTESEGGTSVKEAGGDPAEEAVVADNGGEVGLFGGVSEKEGLSVGEEAGEEAPTLTEALSAEEAREIHGDDDSSQDSKSSVSDSVIQNTTGRKQVYITFDDGPSIYTSRILDILKEYNVRATFFVTGTGDRDENLRPLYKRIVEEGHTLGMHSYSHVYSEVYGSVEAFQDDLDKIRNLIYNETAIVPKYYRFPGGSGNTVSALPIENYIPILYSQGIEYYDWNVYSGDANSRIPSKSVIVDTTLSGVDKQVISVVLFHDTGAKRTTVEALPEILEGLQERGVEFLPFDENAPLIHQREIPDNTGN